MDNLPYNAVMIDLETMGTSLSAPIISIGAVKFWLNVKQTEFPKEQLFYTAVSLESNEAVGRKIEVNTLIWWLQQSKDAQAVFSESTMPLYRALLELNSFVNKDMYIFGNGSTFDNMILRSAYKDNQIAYPVSYKYDVCYRTLRQMSDIPFPEFVGTKHNALDDAISQTKHLMLILEKNPWAKL